MSGTTASSFATPAIQRAPQATTEKASAQNLQPQDRGLMDRKMLIFFGVVTALLAALWWFNRRGIIQGFQNPTEPTFTMYFAPWCGHCKTAKPEFDQFAAGGKVKVGDKECVVRAVDPEKQPGEAKGKPIRGFPTFLLELPNGVIKEYQGERKTAGYLEFLNKELGVAADVA